MSMPFSVIKCESCEKKWATHMLWDMLEYLLPDGNLFGISRTIAWCNDCNDLSPVEDLPDEDELEERLSEASSELTKQQQLRPNIPVEHRSFFGLKKKQIWPNEGHIEFFENAVQRIKTAMYLQKQRRTGSKCLRCGSLDIHEEGLWDKKQKEYRQDMIHPGCGGRIKVEDSGYRVALSAKHRIYDTEGNFLREEEEQKLRSKNL
jgi:hypothetical protein